MQLVKYVCNAVSAARMGCHYVLRFVCRFLCVNVEIQRVPIDISIEVILALQNRFLSRVCNITRSTNQSSIYWSRTIHPHLGPEAPQKRLISKVTKQNGQN